MRFIPEHWPKGKYNGKRIVGIDIRLSIDILFWIMRWSWNFGEPYIFIGPVCIRLKANYE